MKPAQDIRIVQPEIAAPQKWVPYLLLTIAVFLAYSNVYENTLLFDDNLVITLNEYLRSWKTFGHLLTGSTTEGAHIAGGFYRPVQNILYFFVYQMTGEDPFLFHLLNIAIHASNACLVFALGKKLRFNPWASFFAALIWALHPLHTEVITYISGTAQPLFTFFCLLGLIIILPDFKPKRILLSIPLFILGLLSKEAAVVFPALVVICIFLLDNNRLRPGAYLRTWPLWIIALTYTGWRMTAPGFDGPQTYGKTYDQHNFDTLKLYNEHFWYRFYTFLATLPAYMKLLVWPAGLHMEREFPVFVSLRPAETWEGIAICLTSAGQVIWGKAKRGLPLSWGLLWFAAAHFPNTGLIFAMNSQFLEHWMYLPAIGLLLGLSETAFALLNTIKWRQAKPASAILALTIAAILAMRTVEQNAVWHDAFSFYGNIFKYGETSPRGHNNLALAYMEKEDYPAAIAEFQKAVELTDTYAETRHNLALALLDLPDPDSHIQEAIDNLNRAIEIDPNFYRSWIALAQIYAHTGDHEKEAYCKAKLDEILKTQNR